MQFTLIFLAVLNLKVVEDAVLAVDAVVVALNDNTHDLYVTELHLVIILILILMLFKRMLRVNVFPCYVDVVKST